MAPKEKESLSMVLQEDGLEKGKSGNGELSVLTQYFASIVASFGCVCAGTVLAWTSPVLPQLQSPEPPEITNVDFSNVTNSNQTSMSLLHLTEVEAGFVGSIAAIGSMCGALPAGYLAQKLGLKKALICMSVPFVLNWVLLIFSANKLSIIYVGRFLGGLSTGAICVCVPMYVSEIASVRIRGILGSFFQMSFCLGILVVNVLGSFMTWHYLSHALIVLPALYLLALLWLPNVAPVTDNEEKGSVAPGLLAMLRKSNNLRALKVGLGLVLFQQLSGVNGVIFYTASIFQATGSSLSPFMCTILVASVQLLFSFISVSIIEKRGRKFYLLVSSVGMALSLILLSCYFLFKATLSPYLPLVALVGFILSFSAGFGPIPWLMMSELFSDELKAFACAIVTVTNWATVFLVTLAFPQFNARFGEVVTFAVFAVLCVASGAFVALCVPETRGKTSDQIQDDLKRH